MTHFVLSAVFFFIGIAYASTFEWKLHKSFMHKKITCKWRWLEKILNYPFERHTLIHHQIFKSDHTYHSSLKEEHATIPMAWWNGPVLIFIAVAPWWIAIAILSIWLPFLWSIPLGVSISVIAYFCAYEYFHWCMHDPKGRWFESTSWFRWIDSHHHGHHEHMHKNFNVVCPLADVLFGTYLRPA